ncbi:hypothetical protein [Salinibacterium sp. ZJ70]|uniref:hypothetical protein n=1 Tax=Salinibacterium sp. ZJ70 TaxID=2708084 RepID=UPI00141FAA76|nr:hypothetical protein [Salinibacterium sp. ZJ70]
MNSFQDDAESRLRRAASPVDAPALDPAIVSGAAERPAPRLVRHGRATRVAAVSATALAAVTAGALVLANPFAPQAPLFLAASSAGGAAEASSLAADARMMVWVDYRYEAGAGLSTDGGRGSVYELRRAGTPQSVLGSVAERLGVDGDVVESEWSSAEYPVYLVGSDDGTAPSVTLSWSGVGEWWYSDPAAYPEPVCTTVPVEGGVDGESYEACATPEVPASESLAPSADEAKRLAAELFDVGPGAVTVTEDPWQTTASVHLAVDGQATALVETVAWTTTGRIAWASGHSFEVVERGAFDTVSPAAGVERLADGRWYGAAGPDFQGGMVAFAAESMMRGAESGAGEDGSADEPIIDEPIVEPGLVPDEAPEPEVVHVTLESATATLLLMWDADGNAWLVPGYAYENPDGSFWHTAVSLVEGVIALPEPLEVEPLPADID